MGDRLISLNAAIDALNKKWRTCIIGESLIRDAGDTLKTLPSAQLAQDLTKGCTDTISRQAVLNLIEQSCCDLEYDCDNVALRKEVEELPSAQPGWIPCTPETMPKMTDTYLVQVGINENGEGMHTEVRTADWNVVWHEWYVHTTRCFVGDIIKWMPIPWEGEKP